MRTFPNKIVEALHATKVLGIRAGKGSHRLIGIWVVVVENRAFVRSWGLKPGGWYRTLLENPRCTIKVQNRNISARAIRTRSKRLKDAVSRAYREKYNTRGSLIFVRGFDRLKRRDATIELTPIHRHYILRGSK
jgi:hypothetical protein